MTQKLTTYLFATLFFLLLSASLAAQQHGDQIEKLRTELERTNEIIIRAREVVHSTNSAQAKLAFDQAVALQERAWTAFRAEQFVISAGLTTRARDRAKAAISAGSLSQQNQDVLLRKLERARDILERLREQYAGQVDHRMEQMYHSIKSNLERAWEFFRAGNYRASLGLVNQVEGAGQKLINALTEHTRAKANYERRVEALTQQAEKLRDRLDDCGSETAKMLAQKAAEQIQRAKNFAQKNKYGSALKALQQAHRLVTRALRECGGMTSLQKRLEQMTAQAERLAEVISLSDEFGMQLLNQARQQLQSAKEYLQAERSEAAAAAMKAAQMALKQLKKHLAEVAFRERV